MVLAGSKAALASLLLLCSVYSASAQYAVSVTFASNNGLTGTALSCAQSGGNALFSTSGAFAWRTLLVQSSFYRRRSCGVDGR